MVRRARFRGIKVQAWISHELLERVNAAALRHGITRAAVVRRALVAYMNALRKRESEKGATPE